MKIQFKDSDKKLLILFYIFAIPISLYGTNLLDDPITPIIDTLIYIVFSLFALYIIVFKLFPKYFPQKKILILLSLITLFLIASGCLEIYLYKVNNGYTWKNFTLPNFLMSGLESSLENAGILLGLFLGKKFFDAQIDIQKSEKEKKENELSMLKSQIDPHFLFNNLNTVDSMIDSDPKMAKIYLNRLSKLYRYLIKIKDDEVVPIDEELNFAKDYIFLLEQRFGNAYIFHVHKDNTLNNLLIPPASLQTLLENVVKHNSGSSENPIITEISIDNEVVIVQNNVNKKKDNNYSNGTGLANLKARYKLLSEKDIKIIESEIFSVTLPVLKNVD